MVLEQLDIHIQTKTTTGNEDTLPYAVPKKYQFKVIIDPAIIVNAIELLEEKTFVSFGWAKICEIQHQKHNPLKN